MKLKKTEFYYGVVLHKICQFNETKDQSVNLTLVESDNKNKNYTYKISADHIVNGETWLYMKYANHVSLRNPTCRSRKWNFTFQESHLRDIKYRLDSGQVHLALCCINNPLEESRLAFLTPKQIQDCLNLRDIISQQWVSVEYVPERKLLISSNYLSEKGEEDIKIVHRAIENWAKGKS